MDDDTVVLPGGHSFLSDRVFAPTANSAAVFEYFKPLIDHTLKGNNSSMIYYGEAQTGKTFTMLGDEQEPGSSHTAHVSFSFSTNFIHRDRLAPIDTRGSSGTEWKSSRSVGHHCQCHCQSCASLSQ